jgi:hypothetical protein
LRRLTTTVFIDNCAYVVGDSEVDEINARYRQWDCRNKSGSKSTKKFVIRGVGLSVIRL